MPPPRHRAANFQAPKAPKQEAQEQFTPPPISKKPSGNDIGSLWQMLLANINHQPTIGLLRLATPVKIAADGIIITFKTEANVANFNRDENKKQKLDFCFVYEKLAVLYEYRI